VGNRFPGNWSRWSIPCTLLAESNG